MRSICAIVLAAAMFSGATGALAAAPGDDVVGWENPTCEQTADPNFTGYCLSPAGRLDITIHAFHLRSAETGELVTIASATRTFDFASVSANTEIGDYASELQIPYGTYDALGFTIDFDVLYSGQTDGGAAGNCAITPTGFSTSLAAAGVATTNFQEMAGGVDDADAIVDGRMTGIDDEAEGVPFTVSEGDTVHFSMSVSAGKGVWYQYTNGVCVDAGAYGPRVMTGFSLN